MLHQKVIEQSGFRSLHEEQLEEVHGGFAFGGDEFNGLGGFDSDDDDDDDDSEGGIGEDILVTGDRAPIDLGQAFANNQANSGGAFHGVTFSGNAGGGTPPEDSDQDDPNTFLTDEDGDGVAETVNIVVSAERVELGDGYHAYILADGHYDIFRTAGPIASLFFNDEFVGHFLPDEDGSFVIQDPSQESTVTLTTPTLQIGPLSGGGASVERGTGETPQTRDSFERIPAPRGGGHAY